MIRDIGQFVEDISLGDDVTVGRGSVIAADSVVTKSTRKYSVNGGVPARFIRMWFTDEEISGYERLPYGE